MKRIFSLTLSLFLQFHHLFASSENHYGDCKPTKCGNQIIQYPFHIQNDQKPYCGYPGFGVSCNSDSFPEFNISGDAYIITNISYETQKFQVINSALVAGVPSRQGCFQSIHNLTMPPNNLINFSMNHDYIYVFPDCSEKVLKEYRDKRVKCGRLAVYKNDTKLQDLEKKCNGVVIEVPYYDEGQTKGKVMDMLERGVLLNWKAYNCSVCLESGGQCGFDEPNNQFNCYCPDRTHALHCVPPPPSLLDYSNSLQKSFCGQQGFEVTCSKNHSIINLSNDTYAIQEISYEFQSMHILNTAFIDSSFNCTLGIHSFTLDENRFEFSSTPSEVFYLQDCNNKVKNSIGEYKEESCISSNISRGNLIAIYAQGRNLSQFAGKCKKVVSVPYEGKNVTDIDGALRMGVQLKWNATYCGECTKSGGRCGYHYETSPQVQCFCRDGVYPHRCPQSEQKKLLEIAVVGSSFGAVVLIAFIVICAKRRQRTKKFTALWTRGTVMNQNVEAFLKSYGSFAPKRYTYGEIRKMTGNFKDKLGEGGYGAVYKGKLHDSRLVAVKKLKRLKGDGDDFINEVVSMGRTNHVNIVTLLGFCFEGNKRALVFEFLPNGSLEKFIYSSASGQSSLPSDTLYSIAVGIAKGLDYLHRGCNTRILHFDIKPHNILLDEELRPKISDFGLARLCPPKDSLISMSEARGTIGYIAPEVFCRNFGGVSHKSDVYSYGMMLLDMVCGRNNVVAEAQRTSDMYFPDWIYSRLELRDEIESDGIIDDDQLKQLQRKMILVGLWCIQSYPSNRPPMNRVIEMLEGQVESLQVPPKPHLSSPPNPVFNSSENSMLSMGNQILQG